MKAWLEHGILRSFLTSLLSDQSEKGGAPKFGAPPSTSRGSGSIPDRVILLCFWKRHFTLTMPLSTQEYKWVYFFSQRTRIWLVLSAVRIFLSLSTGKITLSWVAEYISTFVAIFPKSILFFWPGTLLSKVFLGKSCRLKTYSFSLFFLQSLWLSAKNCFRNEFLVANVSIETLSSQNGDAKGDFD